MLIVKCGLHEKNNIANAVDGSSPVKKMFQDRAEALLGQSC